MMKRTLVLRFKDAQLFTAIIISTYAVLLLFLIMHQTNTSVKAEVDEFMPFVPVVVALRTPGMRPRHWDALSAKLDMDLHPDASYTLTKLIEV
jgi:hypothetical protein